MPNDRQPPARHLLYVAGGVVDGHAAHVCSKARNARTQSLLHHWGGLQFGGPSPLRMPSAALIRSYRSNALAPWQTLLLLLLLLLFAPPGQAPPLPLLPLLLPA